MDLQISCINKTNRYDPERIANVGGLYTNGRIQPSATRTAISVVRPPSTKVLGYCSVVRSADWFRYFCAKKKVSQKKGDEWKTSVHSPP